MAVEWICDFKLRHQLENVYKFLSPTLIELYFATHTILHYSEPIVVFCVLCTHVWLTFKSQMIARIRRKKNYELCRNTAELAVGIF